jgi:hypothetical protein
MLRSEPDVPGFSPYSTYLVYPKMHPRLRATGCLLLLVAASACQDTTESPPTDPTTPAAKASAAAQEHARGIDRTGEAHGRRFASEMPGFGGWYFDDNGDLNVWIRDAGVHGARARAVAAQVAQEVRLAPATPGYKIIVREGRYGWQELSDWRDRVEMIAERLDGARFVDLDEYVNRVTMGVNSGRARAQARKQATEAGVPVSALSIQIVSDCPPEALDCNDPCSLDPSSCQDPCSIDPSDPSCTTDPCEINPSDPACQAPPDDAYTPVLLPEPSMIANQTLDSEFSTLRAGIRTRNPTRLSGDNPCSIGAIARSSTYGTVFVTASHCTYDQGGAHTSSPRDFYRHYVSRPLLVGMEVFDPPYVTPSGCSWYSTGQSCYLRRNSDAALIQIQNRASEIGTIARPADRKREGQGRGSLSIDPSRPKLSITSTYTGTVARGMRVDKIGATTGWTSGTVQSVCLTEYQTSPNKRQHTCQNTVNYLNEFGDSGGPVFFVVNEAQGTVQLMGIHHMKKGTYSPLAQIAKDIPGLVYR